MKRKELRIVFILSIILRSVTGQNTTETSTTIAPTNATATTQANATTGNVAVSTASTTPAPTNATATTQANATAGTITLSTASTTPVPTNTTATTQANATTGNITVSTVSTPPAPTNATATTQANTTAGNVTVSTASTTPAPTNATATPQANATTANATISTTTTPAVNSTNTSTVTTTSSSPITTVVTTTTTAAVTVRPQPTVGLSVPLKTKYTTQLSDPNTPEFKSLAAQLTQLLNQIYTILFGSKYRGCRVKAFRPQPIRALQNTDADVELIFDENSTTPIPSGEAAATALKEAVDNSSTLSALINSSAITVLNQPIDVTVIFLTNGTFTAALSNTSSDSFTTRTLMIKNGLNPFFTQDFPNSFSLLTMLNYSTGTFKAVNDSIMNNMDLAFNSSAGNPNTTQIAETMFRAANSGTLPFQIYITSITVNGTVFNSGDASSKISVLMACFMVAVSLLFTRFS